MTVRAVTIVHEDWSRSSEELLQTDPRKLKAAFLQHLQRHGARDATGWLFASIHGDFDPDTKRFQLHYHIVAAGGMVRRAAAHGG